MTELHDLISPDAVVVGLRAADKPTLLAELSRQAAARTGVPSERIMAALVARERLGSTGLGGGFALPHARVEGIARATALFARLARPIEYGAVDGARVDLVCLLLIPASGTDHVAALAAVARRLRQDAVAQGLRTSADAASAYALLAG